MHLAVSLQTLSLSDLGNRLIPRALRDFLYNSNNNNNNRVVFPEYSNLVFADRSIMDEDPWFECDGGEGSCFLPPPPPFFDLPPPPKPPQIFQDEEDCQDNPSFSQILDQLETCDHTTLILGPSAHFENAFHSVAVVLVCAIVLVMISMVAGVVVFKRRKTISSLLTDVGSRFPAAFSTPGSSSSGHRGAGSSSSSQDSGRQNFYHQQQLGMMSCPAAALDSSVTLSSTASNSTPKKLFFYTMKRDSTTGDELDSRQNPTGRKKSEFQGCHSLPNHYIQQENHKVFQQHQQHQHGTCDPRQQRLQLADPGVSRNRMELASQPPPNANPHIYHNFPHIIIGGQPFYLIPSDPELAATFGEQENSYAYPQNMPIYEEILEDSFSVSSDQGEVGSLSRNAADTPRLAAVNVIEQPSKARVLVNPLVRDLAFQDFRPIQPHREDQHLVPPMNSSSPSASQTSSSVYYYSDTLKKPSAGSSSFHSSGSGSNMEHSDSGFSNRSTCTKMPMGSSSSSSGSSIEASTRPTPASLAPSASAADAVETQVVVVLDDQDIVLPLTKGGEGGGKIKATTLV